MKVELPQSEGLVVSPLVVGEGVMGHLCPLVGCELQGEPLPSPLARDGLVVVGAKADLPGLCGSVQVRSLYQVSEWVANS